MRIGLYGGTFDPVHNGHLQVARAARDAGGLDRVVFIPCYRQPLKPGRPGAPDADRLAMLYLALAGESGFEVSDYEIRRGGVSYTWDTVQHFSRHHPDSRLHLLIGGDSAVTFNQWRNWKEILDRVILLVAPRPGYSLADCAPEVSEKLTRIPMDEVDLAAETIRERIARGASVQDLLPEVVAAYIAEHGLYR